MTETPPRKMPWSRWYFADWRADPALRMCSLAARGLWMDLLALMHESEPYGHLLIRGVQPTSKQIAALVGASEREVVALLAELSAAGVSSMTDDGVRYSRRMVRDKAKERADRQNGNAGGNPDLALGTVPKAQRARPFKRSDAPAKTDRVYQMRGGTCFWCSKRLQRQTPGHDFFHVDHYRAIRDGGTNDESNLVPACAECNHARDRLPLGEDQNPENWVSVGTEPDTNAGVSVGLAADRKAQKLEARSQTLEAREEQAQAASPPCAPATDDGHDPFEGSPKLPVLAPPVSLDPVALAVTAYNQAAREAGWPQCGTVSPRRRGAMKARLRELGKGGADPLAGWNALLETARKSTFLTSGARFFSFDWVTKAENFLKLREGNYDDAPHGTRSGARPQRGTVALVAAGFAALGDADRDK